MSASKRAKTTSADNEYVHSVAVVGGGSFGTVMARIVATAVSQKPADFASRVGFWVRRRALAEEITAKRTNNAYTGNMRIPENVDASDDLASVVKGADIVVLAVPHEFLDAVLSALRAALQLRQRRQQQQGTHTTLRVVSLVKGFDVEDLGTSGGGVRIGPLSRRIRRALTGTGVVATVADADGDAVAVADADADADADARLDFRVSVSALMGPNIYREMAVGMSAAGEPSVAFAEGTLGCDACEDAAGASLLASMFATDEYAVELAPPGSAEAVELCGSLKNVYTLGCGFLVGSGLGANAKAAVIRRAHSELPSLALALVPSLAGGALAMRAANTLTCGLGDLVLSCTAGRGQQLAAAFARQRTDAGTREPAAERTPDEWMDAWADLERKELGSHRIPDHHNVRAVWAALDAAALAVAQGGAGVDAESRARFPLFHAIHDVAFCGAQPRDSMLRALRSTVKEAATPGSLPTSVRGYDFGGARALVTGAGGGIGRAIVIDLLRAGARVLALDVSLSALDGLRAACESVDGKGGIVLQLECHVANLLDVPALEALVRGDSGGDGGDGGSDPIKFLVNCAGVAKFEPILQTTPSEFERQYNVNVKPCIFLTQAVAAELVRRGVRGGSVVHISSQSATLPVPDHVVYSSSKAAVDHIGRIQALDLGVHGIRVNTVRPGVVTTPLSLKAWDPVLLDAMRKQAPLQALATPEDIARTVTWLLSDDAAMVTGAAIPVDGGRSMGGCGL